MHNLMFDLLFGSFLMKLFRICLALLEINILLEHKCQREMRIFCMPAFNLLLHLRIMLNICIETSMNY